MSMGVATVIVDEEMGVEERNDGKRGYGKGGQERR
jgi:hypothetical protein